MNNWPRIKPPSKISSWHGWPEDVRPVLRKWNQQKRLSFLYARDHGVYNRIPYFKCYRCEEFCGHQTSGDCIFIKHGKVQWRVDFHRRGWDEKILKGNPYCDDCMIALTREYLMLQNKVA
jgi:hypothetical protein